jgi:two-component system, NarL family, response regulator
MPPFEMPIGRFDKETDSPCETRKQLSVLIADDHPVVREGLVTLINRCYDMQVVAEARNGREAVEEYFAQVPDITLLDLRMPVMSGVQAVESIRKRAPGARLIILTSYHTEEDVYGALHAGVQGYLLKDAMRDELIGCIHAVNEGRTWIPPVVGATLAKRLTGRQLTVREAEVLCAMSKGKSNKEIGAILNISEATVKVHMTHILEKLRVAGRTEAIHVAANRGLVKMDSLTAVGVKGLLQTAEE